MEFGLILSPADGQALWQFCQPKRLLTPALLIQSCAIPESSPKVWQKLKQSKHRPQNNICSDLFVLSTAILSVAI